MTPLYRNVAVVMGLLLAWIVLITVEVKGGVVEQLKLVYALSIPLAFAGFVWAWIPAPWARTGGAQVSKLRVGLLAFASTVIAVGVVLVVGMNYKIAIGGTF